jgi:hypothetical protein
MAAARILYFTSSDHFVYRRAGGALQPEAKFPADDLGVTEFREYLRGHKGALFYLLADLAGEDFHEDQIPYLRGGDREAIVQRRLAQRYRDTRLAAALPLGVTSGERRNERLLLASFTNTQQFFPWLDALAEAGAKLAGVFSVPLLAPALAARLGARSGRSFVVTANRAGLRQCFVEDGRLRFARLEPTVDMVPQALAMFVRTETQRLAQYLATLRVLPRDGAPIQVLVVAPPGQKGAFEQALVSDTRLAFHTHDAAQAGRAVGLAKPPEGALAEALYLQLALRRPPAEQFAQREDRRGFLLWKLQRGVVAAGALGLAACSLYAGVKWLDVASVRDQAAIQRREANAAAEQYQRITSGFPVVHTTTDNLRATVVEFLKIAKRSAAPESGLAHLSRVLEQYPQIELENLKWSVGRAEGALARAESAAAAQPKPAAAAPGAAGAPAEAEHAETLEISGRVHDAQRSDYRGITAQVQRFAAALTDGSPYAVVRTQLPFDITSEGTLTGDIGAGSGDTGEAPRFTIAIARPLR